MARSLNQARGLQGKKGVLWWQIHRLLEMRRPPYLFLENVDRLLKSPANQRGRDFAIMLATLNDLGYEVEWRVVNAADYGFPQRRRRVYIVGRLTDGAPNDANEVLNRGIIGRALPVAAGPTFGAAPTFTIDGEPADISETFGARSGQSWFRSAGYCADRQVWTADLAPAWDGPRTTLGDILEVEADVPGAYRIPDTQLAAWRYLKGAKREPREHKASGTPYLYVEGAVPFPDPTDGPSRTILTAEGGSSPSRFKHVVATPDGYRRLTPRELERLNGFPDDWTDTGMPEGRRAFAMGNALVVGIVERIGAEIARELREPELREPGELPAAASPPASLSHPVHDPAKKTRDEHPERPFAGRFALQAGHLAIQQPGTDRLGVLVGLVTRWVHQGPTLPSRPRQGPAWTDGSGPLLRHSAGSRIPVPWRAP